jgi:predicted transcriptional regulator
MSTTLTIRLPKELKERAARLKVNWAEEIRRFLERKVREYELLELLEELEDRAAGRKVSVDSVSLIREDRGR